jgi:hypothetical protein
MMSSCFQCAFPVCDVVHKSDDVEGQNLMVEAWVVIKIWSTRSRKATLSPRILSIIISQVLCKQQQIWNGHLQKRFLCRL